MGFCAPFFIASRNCWDQSQLLIYICNVKKSRSQLSCGIEVLQCLLDASSHRLLPRVNPDTRIVILLVRFVLSFWIAHLRHQVFLLVQYVVANTRQVSPLKVGIEVDFNNAVSDRLQVLLLSGARAAVEHQENRLVLLCTDGFLNILLVLTQ
jgi:hypothetical protein